MNPDRFAHLKELVLTARSLPEEERLCYLDESCSEDPELLRDALSLLEFPTRPNLHTAGLQAWLGPALAAAPVGPGRIPEFIGPYRVVGLLGQGGMGAVYHAEQTEPFHRNVAVKLVRRFLTSPQAMARFHAEAETLALMDHSNIARIFDAGEDRDGNPFFVMELVRGVPITDFARMNRLSRADRIQLCLSICRAVHHAHQKGIIHRDLKPSNILVTMEDGVPTAKVIDFGVAKVIGDARDEGSMTREGQVLGTLEYMSPEQARGRTPGAQTDVYSLGVILFELLTGTLPHDIRDKTIPEAVRVIAECPPRRLRRIGTRTDHLDRDLRTILQKCLDPDPARRYETAAALADDLERYLSSEPILARPQSTSYHFKKLVGRHKALFALAAVLIVSLITYGVTMSVLFASQREARQTAEIEAAKAERISTFLREMLNSVQPGASGRDVTVVQVLDEAARRAAENLDEEPVVQAELRQTIGRAYMSLEKFAEARELLDQARIGLEEQVGSRHPKIADLCDDLTSLGFYLGDLGAAEGYARKALDMHRFFDGEDSPGVRTSLNNLAFVLLRRGHPAEAESLYRESLVLGRRLLGEEDPDVSVTLNNLGHALSTQGRYQEAEEVFRESLALRLKIFEPGHPWIAGTRANLASVLLTRGAYTEAEAICRRSIDLAITNRGQAAALDILASILRDTDRLEEAETVARSAVEKIREAFGDQHVLFAQCLYGLGRILHTRSAFAETEDAYRKALALREKLLDPDHIEVGVTALWLGKLAMSQGRIALADSLLNRALTIQEMHREGASWLRNQARIARALCLAVEGRATEAQEIMGRFDPRPLWSSALDRRADLHDALNLCEQWGWKEKADDIRRELDRVPVS